MQSQRLLKKTSSNGYFRRRWRFWVISFCVAAIAVPALVFLTVRGVSSRIIFVAFYVAGDSAFLVHTFRRILLNPLFLTVTVVSSFAVPWIYLSFGTSWKISWFFATGGATQILLLFVVRYGLMRLGIIHAPKPAPQSEASPR
jgi:hypothetical protein